MEKTNSQKHAAAFARFVNKSQKKDAYISMKATVKKENADTVLITEYFNETKEPVNGAFYSVIDITELLKTFTDYKKAMGERIYGTLHINVYKGIATAIVNF